MRRRRRPKVNVSVVTGRPLSGSSWPAQLPRSYTPVSNTQVMARARGLLGVYKRPLRKLAATVKTTARPRLVKLLRPVFNGHPNPCRKRSTRKEVMFSLGVAGRSWARKGPNMRAARRSLNSQLSCRGS